MQKAQKGAIDGSVAGAITVLVMYLVKISIKDMDANTENIITGVVGLLVSSAVISIKSWIDNYMKHRNDGKTPVTTPVPPAAPSS